jgi:hypothetical protein
MPEKTPQTIKRKLIQHHVRYLGSDPDNLPNPSSFDIEKIHFGYLAQLILSDTISADDVYLMRDGMGKPVKRKELKEIVIRYNIEEAVPQLIINIMLPKGHSTVSLRFLYASLPASDRILAAILRRSPPS